ncbi:cox cluster protein [Haloarchaeobius sp. HME9146]|uniref:DUF7541 family protein n=1 Tax=Haloarchaeobius sp. HME9146 TaxID=2978732 RepID=UPI0021C1B087|nr:cox cluster protein [Haloarchaeobius sp. HME9146]MCT9096244.1 cox cluster protein [Haloarchaeobius sp. HME9146]
MAEESQSSTRAPKRPKASAWPMLIAVGLAVSEVGVLFGSLPISVFGLLMFCGSIAGIFAETGYVDQPWTIMAAFAAVLVLIGGYLFVDFGGTLGGAELVGVDNRIAYRGVAIAMAGVVTLVAAVVGLFQTSLDGSTAP